ncbi:MAG: hypothetical protein HEP70_14275 [Rhodobiaceae bacterium]|nr:hypothetical protein [Rhodobiaceae bacterium]
MSMRDESTANLTQPVQLADWTDLPRQAWGDIREATELAWEAWVGLFPKLELWDPVGAALSLSLLVLLIVWLIKVRPG